MSSQDPTQVDPASYQQHPQYQPPQPPPPGQQPPYEPPPGYAPRGRNPAQEALDFARRHLRTPETKEFFRTSEFLVWLLACAAILIAAIIADPLDAEEAWRLVAFLSAAYILSRGISKAGTRRGWDQPGGGTGSGEPGPTRYP